MKKGKGYLRYKTITLQNVSYKAHVKVGLTSSHGIFRRWGGAYVPTQEKKKT